MKIEVLGTGCAKCNKLFDETRLALAASGVQAELLKVEKIDEIVARGVAITPALVIDGEVRSAGRIPKAAAIASWIRAAAGV